jgi:hypothetical protein
LLLLLGSNMNLEKKNDLYDRETAVESSMYAKKKEEYNKLKF